MRILLIRPPVPRRTIGLKNIMVCEPLELEYLAAALGDHEVQIMDMILERGLEARLRSFEPEMVGTSCYISGVNEVKKLCRTVKRHNPECFTVVGGVQAARCSDDFIEPSIDCIALGGDPGVMREIAEALETRRPLSEVPGLALRHEGHLHQTASADYMPCPDTLPLPRRDLVAHLNHRYYYAFHQPVALVKSTWGCWYQCNFCYTWRITDGHVYSRSPESIVDELETIEAGDIYIVDDIFLINRHRLSRLAELIRERGIDKKFLVYSRADFICDNEDIIAEWASIGLRAVFIGLEASTDAELESMQKRCTVDKNRLAVEVLRRNGVDTYGSLIPNPEYGPEDWERLWRFVEDTGLYYVNISPLTPLPGTKIWDQYRDRVTVPRSAHELWDFSHVVLPTRMSLRAYYWQLLKLYAKTTLNPRRAKRLALRTRPPVWSFRYLRLWFGAVRILFQILRAHRHHDADHLSDAMDLGPAVVPVPPLLGWKPSDEQECSTRLDVDVDRLTERHHSAEALRSMKMSHASSK